MIKVLVAQNVSAPPFMNNSVNIESTCISSHRKRSANELAVRLGEWNFKEPSESVPHQDYLVKEILVHPNHVPSILAYDVALLILSQPAVLGHTVDTLCLPPPFYDFKDHVCVVSGWGKDVFSEVGKFQQVSYKSVNSKVNWQISMLLVFNSNFLQELFRLTTF